MGKESQTFIMITGKEAAEKERIMFVFSKKNKNSD